MVCTVPTHMAACCPLMAACALPPQYEQTLAMVAEPDLRWQLQAEIRKNITETLVSLRVNTVDDIQQIAAVLAQCMVGWASLPESLAGHEPFLGEPSMSHRCPPG